MAKKYPYARWVADKMRGLEADSLQAVRNKYYSDTGRIENYDDYARWCRLFGYDYDDSPEGYWESKFLPWHKPAGIVMGAIGVMTWLVLQIITDSTGRMDR